MRNRTSRPLLALLIALPLGAAGLTARASDEVPDSLRSLTQKHCLDCHTGEDAEAGLDLAALEGLASPNAFDRWVRIFDRVDSGEMPPADASTVTAAERDAFRKVAGRWLNDHEQKRWAEVGRVQGRRLTNLQLERSLHALLGIDIPLAEQLPVEPRDDGFTTVADGQSMSHFQLEQHLGLVDVALDEAYRRAFSSPDEWSRTYDARQVARTNPRRRCREPELIDNTAVTWSSRLVFYGRLPVTTAREDGWYRFTIHASGLKPPEGRGVWCTVRTGKCVSTAPLMATVGAFAATDEPGAWTYEAWLPKGHMLEVRPGDRTLKGARFNGGQVGTGEGGPQNVPGVAIHALEVDRIHLGPDRDGIRGLLFGDLAVETAKGSEPRVVSTAPEVDIARLMTSFARRAFRRPVTEAEVAPYVDFALSQLAAGQPFAAALRGGYRALLCSPRFLYLQEQPGRLDDHAVATRLAYFLWNAPPDEELTTLADAGRLQDTTVIGEQVERMLADDRGRAFVRDFAAQWLDLDLIDFTDPDSKLFPDFDPIVQESMLAETHAYLATMLDEDLSVGRLIDSDFTYLDERLARYYGIRGVEGDELRRVSLSPQDHRGGILTQGAILKVTANGTTTSPVIRGVWVSERLLGVPIPPPPKDVPAIEPDIRGAKSIRDMLEKHKADASCASCHVKIDPPGFALENFDPAGRWRDAYGARTKGGRTSGAAVDPSFETPDGRHFDDVNGFKQLVLANPDRLARNVARQLLTYGTGAPVSFADRGEIDAIVDRTAASDYGFRSLIREVATSEAFLSK